MERDHPRSAIALLENDRALRDRSLTQDRLRIDERILHYLTGVQYIDERLTSLVEPVSAIDDVLSVSQTTWRSASSPFGSRAIRAEQPPVVHLFRRQ